MSQAKVDQYKEDKKNRAKIIKKQKREWFLTKAALAVFAVVIIGWCGVSIVQNITKPSTDTAVERESFSMNTTAVDDYISTLPVD